MWLQFVAFVPFWWALGAQARAGRAVWHLGACLAIGNAVPLLSVVGSSPPIVAAMMVAVLEWMLIASVTGRLLRRESLLGALAAAAVVALIEIVTWAPTASTAG